MSTPEAPQPTAPISAAQQQTDSTTRGATVDLEYVERGLKIYGITEVEMDGLTLIGTGVAGGLSVFTLFIGLAVPTVISIILSAPTGLAAFALWVLVMTFVLIAVGAFVLMIVLHKRRGPISDRIKRESKQVGPPR
jgi:hypothetical protein